MKPRSLLFCGFCALVIFVPANPNPYAFFIDTTKFFIDSFCYHYFRAFLSCGTPASKTIFNNLLWNLTVSFQLHFFIICFYVLLGYWFNASIEELVNSNPFAGCALFTPRWSTILICVYFFYLATLKLIIALKPFYLMQLNQERVALQLNILVFVLCIVDSAAALLFQGSTCNVLSAPFYLKITTGLQFKENALDNSSSSSFLLPIILLSVVEYAAAEIIVNFSSYKVWLLRCRERISYYICNDMQINRANSVFIVIPLENYGQPQPQPLTQFQKTMKLIKGMGTYAAIFFLVANLLLIFFELSFIIQLILSIGGRLLFLCTPIYWVLVVDDVYEFTKRRTVPVLTSVYHYFTGSEVYPQNIRSQKRMTKFNRVAVETQRELLPITGLPTTVLRVADERTKDVLPSAETHISVMKVAADTPKGALSITGFSTTVPRRAEEKTKVHNVGSHITAVVSPSDILPVPGSSTARSLDDDRTRDVSHISGSSTAPRVTDVGARYVFRIAGSSTTLPRIDE